MNSAILFVDDQQEVLDVLKRIFARDPYQLFFATSVDEALHILQANPVDVLVTDVVMPGRSGLELIQIAQRDYPDTVRIVLSGFSQVATILEALNSGEVYRYITKPWKVSSEAKDVIRQAVEYANILKLARQASGAHAIAVRPDELRAIMSLAGRQFVLISPDGDIVVSSAGTEGQIFDPDNPATHHTIELANGHKLKLGVDDSIR